MVAINVDGGKLLDALVRRIGEPGQQRIVLELGGEQEVGVLHGSQMGVSYICST